MVKIKIWVKIVVLEKVCTLRVFLVVKAFITMQDETQLEHYFISLRFYRPLQNEELTVWCSCVLILDTAHVFKPLLLKPGQAHVFPHRKCLIKREFMTNWIDKQN